MDALFDWLKRYDVASLVLVTLMSLALPSFIGFSLDRILGTGPVIFVLASLAGILFASRGITRIVQARYDALAPGGRDEEDR